MGRIAAYVGGARSGKSRLALARARAFGEDVAFVATLRPEDDEMRARVERHRRARPDSWRTVEGPVDLAPALRELPAAQCIVVDCLTLWVSNLLLDERTEAEVLEAFEDVLAAARKTPAEVIFVSNEVGCGIVPQSAIGRRFRDVAGLVNRRLAEAADEAYWVVCGRPVPIKQGGRDHVLV
jgi:adenosylcobinamide kinase/adenosylcobinamide-phosphate guanylyltransferase